MFNFSLSLFRFRQKKTCFSGINGTSFIKPFLGRGERGGTVVHFTLKKQNYSNFKLLIFPNFNKQFFDQVPFYLFYFFNFIHHC
jgi:hypothetical protein